MRTKTYETVITQITLEIPQFRLTGPIRPTGPRARQFTTFNLRISINFNVTGNLQYLGLLRESGQRNRVI